MRIIVGNTQQPWRPVFQDLLDRHGIKPVLMVNPGPGEAKFLAANPDIICVNWYEVMRGLFGGRLAACADGPFDRHCQKVWNEDSPLILDQYNRLDHGADFSFQERKLHLFQQIVFWNAVLELLQPDAMFFPFTPHVVTDNVMLALARSRGIPCAEGDYVLEAGKYVFRPSRPWSCYNTEVSVMRRLEAQAGLQINDGDLHEWHAALISRLGEGKTAYNHASYASDDHEWRKGEGAAEAATFWIREMKALGRGVWGSLRDVVKGRLLPWCCQKEKGVPYDVSYTGRLARLRFHWGNLKAKCKARALQRAYARHARANENFKPQPGVRYVLLALHYQPEASTNPLGGMFTDMYIAANMLRHSLPPGWELLIKEHPCQFFTESADLTPYQGHAARVAAYYDVVSSSGRIRLLPLEYPSPVLLDCCSAIATVTGSIGIEASARGKPLLCFGDVFYHAVEGVFRVGTLDDCRAAMREIDAGCTVSVESLRRHLSEMEMEQCEISSKYAPCDRSWQDGGHGFADAIAGALHEARTGSHGFFRPAALLDD